MQTDTQTDTPEKNYHSKLAGGKLTKGWRSVAESSVCILVERHGKSSTCSLLTAVNAVKATEVQNRLPCGKRQEVTGLRWVTQVNNERPAGSPTPAASTVCSNTWRPGRQHQSTSTQAFYASGKKRKPVAQRRTRSAVKRGPTTIAIKYQHSIGYTATNMNANKI